MKTNKIISLAIFALLPIAGNAENISGAMYTAPTAADTNHPAPTTQADAPYGRANIDTADQEHIATTAYVKGAYNSAIAAVNKLNSNVSTGLQDVMDELAGYVNQNVQDIRDDMADKVSSTDFNNELDGAMAALEENAINYADNAEQGAKDYTDAKRVEIYTTWDDDDTAEVALITAQQ